jgi:hypothetical protein
MKALFIDNYAGFYGAQKSLKQLLENYSAVERTLIIPKRIPFERRGPASDLIKRYNEAGIEVYEFYLPFDPVYQGYVNTFRLKAATLIRNILWRINKYKLYKFIAKGRFSYVHLNSTTLNPVIKKGIPFFTHIREILEGPTKSVTKAASKINSSKGLIFIDSAVYSSFPRNGMPPHLILNNPFDMSKVKNYMGTTEDFRKSINIRAGKTVISLIGKITENKGTDFIIKSFIAAGNMNNVLLIIGSGEKQYVEECKKISRDNSNIVFLTETENIEPIYAASDYIIRGEKQFCIGRTIFEGLYSGCGAILPGMAEDLQSEPELNGFIDRIALYQPRDLNNLSQIFNSGLVKIEGGNRKFLSNAGAYAETFHKFILDTL